MTRGARPRRGAVLPLVCVLLVVLVGAAALAIDLGRLYLIGTEVQASADAVALAAARGFQRDPDGSGTAASYASDVYGRNRVAGGRPTSGNIAMVTYNPATRTASAPTSWGAINGYQATVRHTPRYVLAGALGLSAPTISRTATAWFGSVNGMTCVRPFVLPYTRNFEHGMWRGAKPYTANWTNGSGNSPYAPEYTQGLVASLQLSTPNPPRTRTYLMLPPWEDEDAHDGAGRSNTGAWKPADFTGQGGGSYSDYQTLLSTPPGRSPGTSACARATAKVGDVLNALPYQPGGSTNRTPFLNAMAAGMGVLCNRMGNNTDARCFDDRGNFGVRTRVAFADSVPAGGTYRLRVREVTQVRVVCYFRTVDDVCATTDYKDDDGATSSWSPMGADRGYPPGTVAVVLDGPASLDLTPDVVLGTKPGITQRLMLVR